MVGEQAEQPRRRLVGDPSRELRAGMTSLEHSAILIRGLCRSPVELDTVTGAATPTPAAGGPRAAAARRA